MINSQITKEHINFLNDYAIKRGWKEDVSGATINVYNPFTIFTNSRDIPNTIIVNRNFIKDFYIKTNKYGSKVKKLMTREQVEVKMDEFICEHIRVALKHQVIPEDTTIELRSMKLTGWTEAKRYKFFLSDNQ